MYLRCASPLNLRVHIYVVLTTAYSLTATVESVPRPLRFIKRLHRFIHAPDDDLVHILSRSGLTYPSLVPIVSKLSAVCVPCARSGLPLPSKKFSLARIDSAFNNFLHAAFFFS